MGYPDFPRADEDAVFNCLQQIRNLLYADNGGLSGVNLARAQRLAAANGQPYDFGSPTGTLYDQVNYICTRIQALIDSKKLQGQWVDAFQQHVIPTLQQIVMNGIITTFKLIDCITAGTADGNLDAWSPALHSPSPDTDFGYLIQREMYIYSVVMNYHTWLGSLPSEPVISGLDPNGHPFGYSPRAYEAAKNVEPWISQVLHGEVNPADGGRAISFDNLPLIAQTILWEQWAYPSSQWDGVGLVPMPQLDANKQIVAYYGMPGWADEPAAEWPMRQQVLSVAQGNLLTLENTKQPISSHPSVQKMQGSWSALVPSLTTGLTPTPPGGPTTGPGNLPTLPTGPTPPGSPLPPPTNPPVPPTPPNPPNNPPGPPTGSPPGTPPGTVPPGVVPLGAALGGMGTPGIWPDNSPDQFPEPSNLEDVAREIIRKQNGGNRLLLITHFGPPNANTWLVTIADRGNSNFTQDPGDPGSAASGMSGGNGATVTGAGSTLPGAYGPSLSGSNGTGNPDAYVNNTQSVKLELGGALSPYGRFVAESIQQYCTLQSSTTATGARNYSSSSLVGSDAGSILSRLSPSALSGSATTLSGPPTSPQNPALLWLIGHGLGGMVAQNLASQVPFPGDNPNLGPAHIVKGVIALGAPIVGTIAKRVVYSFFKMPGDRIGDIPVDAVGVNDARTKDVHMLSNPFLTPPWQSQDPSKPEYVKDPRDPATIHSAYADSPALAKVKLPFALKKGQWGPTYVVVIPATPTTTGSGTSSNGAPMPIPASTSGTSV
jgi:hypothetical protein